MKQKFFLQIIFLQIVLISSALAQSSRDTTKENKIEAQLMQISPAMVPIFHDATLAMDTGNDSLADSLYSIVYTQVPDFDVVLRRLGSLKCKFGKYEIGEALLNKAVNINRSAYNLLSLAYFYLSLNGDTNHAPKPDYIKALTLLQEAQKLPDGSEYEFPALIAQIALQENLIVDFKAATQFLIKNYPEKMGTHYYASIMNAYDEKWIEAEKELNIAKELGLSNETYHEIMDSGIHKKALIRKLIYDFLWITLGWIVGLFLLYFTGRILSGLTLRTLEKQAQNNSNLKNISPVLRPLYKILINIGGFYYYISLPIILVFVLALVVLLFYFFIMLGHLPVKLMAILAIGAVITVYGMIRSLLVKVKYSDPGRELKREEAPELYKLTEDVAKTIGTRPIDEIRITPLTDLAVYEKGSWRERYQDKAKRILILGAGVINDFRQDSFEAVLAHEYGHFSHRDTAGGDVALRVRNDMAKYAHALYSAGQAVWWNFAFLFLLLYDFIYKRISHGSTRLQEVMADRVSAQAYGVEAFQNGLTFVIKRGIEFNINANQELDNVKKFNKPLGNLYEISGDQDSVVEKELKKAMVAETKDEDTHPSPKDRFRYIKGIQALHSQENNSLVQELFVNWEEITAEMTEFIQKNFKR